MGLRAVTRALHYGCQLTKAARLSTRVSSGTRRVCVLSYLLLRSSAQVPVHHARALNLKGSLIYSGVTPPTAVPAYTL